MAPEISLMRTCHRARFSSGPIIIISSWGGHCHLGRFRRARAGARNPKELPCTIGNLNEGFTKISYF